MELTKWKKADKINPDNQEEPEEIILVARRVLRVSKLNNEIIFIENCDGYFYKAYSKEDALVVVDELKKWIESE